MARSTGSVMAEPVRVRLRGGGPSEEGMVAGGVMYVEMIYLSFS